MKSQAQCSLSMTLQAYSTILTCTLKVIQPPEPVPQKGPSRLGFAVLLGAGLLLVATWHKLTSRCHITAVGL